MKTKAIVLSILVLVFFSVNISCAGLYKLKAQPKKGGRAEIFICKKVIEIPRNPNVSCVLRNGKVVSLPRKKYFKFWVTKISR